jgi:glucose/arabinose dehydrogenase
VVSGAAPVTPWEVTLRLVSDQLPAPTFIGSDGLNVGRLYVGLLAGQLRLVENGVLGKDPLLDIGDLVSDGPEQGLLGVAFDPAFGTNHMIYVSYIDRDGDTAIVRYELGIDSKATKASGKLLLKINRPAGNHNGGAIAFGPDGSLYVALGDGGGGNDMFKQAQDPNSDLGKILRVNVNPDGSITNPAANPYSTGGGSARIFALGLRNPWGLSFDGNMLIVADVGQENWEEILTVEVTDRGPNFGWPVTEGPNCFGGTSCDATKYVAPSFFYSHEVGCAVVGGVVYRGSALRWLTGLYVFSDHCSGLLSAVNLQTRPIVAHQLTLHGASLPNPTAIGQDAMHELYVGTADGHLYAIQ